MVIPPWLRAIQQSWLFHIAQSAALAGGMAWLTCKPDAQAQSCIEVGIAAFVGAFYLTFQHSPGSASYSKDGEPIEAAPKLKELVDTAIDARAKAADPASPVKSVDAAKIESAATDTIMAVQHQAAVIKDTLAVAEGK